MVQRLLRQPGRAVGLLPRVAGGGDPGVGPLRGIEGVGGQALGVDAALAAGQRLQVLPLRGVGEVRHRERHLAAVADPQVELVGGRVAHLRLVLDQVHREVALLLVLHEQDVAARELQRQLGLQQRRAVGEAGIGEVGRLVGRERVPVEAQQVEAFLLVDLQPRAGLGLALGPDVVAPLRRLVVERLAGRAHDGRVHLRVGDGGDLAVGRGRGHALAHDLRDLAVLVGEGLLAQRGAVGDRDHAHAVLGDVDLAELQRETGLVVDDDRGVAAGHAQPAVAGAQDGAGEVDPAARGLDRVQRDLLAGVVEGAGHRRQPARAEADAGADVAVLVGEVDRLVRVEALVDGQLDAVHAALHQAVDVEVAGVDVDRAHREDGRGLGRVVDGGQQRLQPRVAGGQAQRARDARVVEQLLPVDGVEVQVLARVAAGVEPVLGGQVEVARGREVDGSRAQLAGDVDAAVQVGQLDLAVLVDDAAADGDVLRRLRQAHVLQRGVPGRRVGVLQDADDALAARAGRVQRLGVEVGRAGGQHHALAAGHLGAAGRGDAQVVDLQAEGRVVDDADVGRAMGHHAALGHRGLHARARALVGLDVDEAGRSQDRGQAQRQHVEARARRHGAGAAAAGDAVGQAELLQLIVDLVEQRLVARDGLGVAGVAFHPAHDLGPVLEQLVGDVAVHQRGQRQVLGLDDVEVVAQRHGEHQPLVAGHHRQLAPALRLGIGGGAGVEGERIARALVPAAVAGAHGRAGGHRQ